MMLRLFLIAAGATVLAGCASVPADPIARAAYEEANDPLEPLNRAIFAFNMEVDRAVLEPVARGYRRVTTPGIREGVHNFLRNLRAPVTFANDLLQGEIQRAAQTSWDFVMNSTVGILGFFDVTDDADWEPHEEDLGQTLAVWGVKEGPYLVLPFHGPANVRDAAGLFGDRYFDPFVYRLQPPDDARFFSGRTVAGAVDARERTLEEFNELRRTSLDFYVTARSLYQQSRNNQIRNGAPAPLGDFNLE
ncbi:MAG: VacJ family lipoprotein [Alphaproteobacteria bacterium]|nr:VacJ family lipoprotein [Alphaproteobacteria bacterium]MBM4437304.1 VacJ family lipoprotein [Actinomycetota bacterium]